MGASREEEALLDAPERESCVLFFSLGTFRNQLLHINEGTKSLTSLPCIIYLSTFFLSVFLSPSVWFRIYSIVNGGLRHENGR